MFAFFVKLVSRSCEFVKKQHHQTLLKKLRNLYVTQVTPALFVSYSAWAENFINHVVRPFPV